MIQTAVSLYIRIASTNSVLSQCGLYNVYEKSLLEGECKLNYQKHRGQRGKKYIIFLHISTILTQKLNFVFLG